jgi:dolichyl-phosphate-mannose--protein O-mannosyl transferase
MPFFFKKKIDIAYGSRLMLKHVNTVGGYLHSHQKYYSKGSGRKSPRFLIKIP